MRFGDEGSIHPTQAIPNFSIDHVGSALPKLTGHHCIA
jgi:hypothetical protein